MWKRVISVGLAVFILGGAGTAIMLDRIVRSLLQTALHAQGFSDARVAAVNVGWRESQVSGLYLGNDFTIPKLSLGYGLGGDLKPRLLAVHASGMTIDTSHMDTGAVGVLRRRLAENDGGAGGAGFADDLTIGFDGVSLRHGSDGMNATVLANGSLRRKDGAMAFQAELSADMVLGALDLKANAMLDGSLDHAGTFRLETRLRRIDAGDKSSGVRAEALMGSIRLAGKGLKISMAQGHLEGGLGGPPPLDGGGINLDLALSDGRLQLTGRVRNDAADLRFRLASGLDIQQQQLTDLRAHGYFQATPKLKALLPAALRGLSYEAIKADLALFASALDLGELLQWDEPRWMQKAHFQAALTLEAASVAYPEVLSQAAVLAAFDIIPSEGGLNLSLSTPVLIEGHLDPALAKRAGGLAEQAAFFLAHPVSLTLESANPAQPVARLRYQDHAWRLDGEPELSLAMDWTNRLHLRTGLAARWAPSPLLRFKAFDLGLRNISYQGHVLPRLQVAGFGGLQDGRLNFSTNLTGTVTPGPMGATVIGAAEVSARLDGWLDRRRLEIKAPKGSVIVSSLRTADGVRLVTPLRLDLEDKGASISGDWRKALSVQGQWRSQPVAFFLPGPSGSTGERREISMAAMRFHGETRLTGGTPGPFSIGLATDRISSLHDGVVLGNIHAKFEQASAIAAPEITVSVARATYLKDGLHPPTMALQARARLRDKTVRFTLEAKADDAGVLAIVEGRHDIDGGSGGAEIRLPALTFARAGLQPARFADALDPLGEVEGSITAGAALAWDADGVVGDASVLLNDLSFVAADVTVASLAGELAFSGLFPPRTAASQRITVGLVGAGVPLRDVVIDFQLLSPEAAKLPVLRIDHAEARMINGMISLDDTAIDFSAESQKLSLKLADIDLAGLARVADIEGLSGRGRLSGVLPITIKGERIAVSNGRLRTDQPGVVNFSSPVATQALGGAVEEMDLLLKIVENLEYEVLSIDLDKSFDGGTQSVLKISGRNPDLMDGRPVRLRIGLEGNLDQLLDTVAAATSLSERAIRATVKGHDRSAGEPAKRRGPSGGGR